MRWTKPGVVENLHRPGEARLRPLPFLFVIKTPCLLRSYLCSTPFVM
jgi:hypothetical protein